MSAHDLTDMGSSTSIASSDTVSGLTIGVDNATPRLCLPCRECHHVAPCSMGATAETITLPPRLNNAKPSRQHRLAENRRNHLRFGGSFWLFFLDNDLWWRVFGRFAAPPFFFLVGYAQSRTVPLHWIGIGVILTLLESWNADWTWVPPNILLSFVLIRIARPYVDTLLQNRGWVAFIVVGSVLLALLPVATTIVDYGAEGWLWALFGLCQRRYLDGMSAVGATGGTRGSPAPTLTATDTAGLMRLLACSLAAVVYVWQDQEEFSFPAVHLAVVILGLGVLSISLCLFKRGESRFQPPEKIASVLRFVGRHTLEIYAIQLAGSELFVQLVPALSASRGAGAL